MKRGILSVMLALLFSMQASADPERSYQGGKKLMNSATGTKPVDDRDAQQRAADWMKKKGAEANTPPAKKKP